MASLLNVVMSKLSKCFVKYILPTTYIQHTRSYMYILHFSLMLSRSNIYFGNCLRKVHSLFFDSVFVILSCTIRNNFFGNSIFLVFFFSFGHNKLKSCTFSKAVFVLIFKIVRFFSYLIQNYAFLFLNIAIFVFFFFFFVWMFPLLKFKNKILLNCFISLLFTC